MEAAFRKGSTASLAHEPMQSTAWGEAPWSLEWSGVVGLKDGQSSADREHRLSDSADSIVLVLIFIFVIILVWMINQLPVAHELGPMRIFRSATFQYPKVISLAVRIISLKKNMVPIEPDKATSAPVDPLIRLPGLKHNFAIPPTNAVGHIVQDAISKLGNMIIGI